MDRHLVSLLCCPHDNQYPLDLVANPTDGATIVHGELHFPTCGARYSIEEGIPRLVVVDEGEGSEIMRQEMTLREQILRKKIKNAHPLVVNMERLPELDAFQRAVGNCRGLVALDAGCGEGAMIPALKGASRIIGLDLCWSALLRVATPIHSPLQLVQGNVCRMPFRNNQFDVVISSQVLQHIPSPRHRTAFISELARTLKPGGQLVLSVYNWSRDAQLEGKPREGFHNGRIYFHCFDPDELRAVLSSAFQVQSIRGVQVIFPKTYRLFTALGKRNIYWDRFWQPREIALRYGRLLVAVCKAG